MRVTYAYNVTLYRKDATGLMLEQNHRKPFEYKEVLLHHYKTCSASLRGLKEDGNANVNTENYTCTTAHGVPE